METSGQPGQPGPHDSTPVPSTEPTTAPADPPQKQADQQNPRNGNDADEDSEFDELDGIAIPLPFPLTNRHTNKNNTRRPR